MSKLTSSMVKERQTLNEHYHAICDIKRQTLSIKDTLNEVVDSELKIIHENEQEYHRLQSEHYRLQQLLEEQEQQEQCLIQPATANDGRYSISECDKINKP